MGRALFDNSDFLAAARELACERGPAAVTVDSVAERLKAPKGSFYYRFASRDALLGELWLRTVLAFQEEFVAAIEAGDGLAAALHTPAWVRAHLDDARLLLLYSRHDFVQGDWPAELKRGVRDQARRFEACLESFAKSAFGAAGPDEQRRAAFVLAEVPYAAVKPHLLRRESPPPLVDELISATYRAIVGAGRAASKLDRRPGSARRSPPSPRRKRGIE
jgi:AcrR family transcriptional regulator